MRKVEKAPPKAKPVRLSVVDPQTGELLIPWPTLEDDLRKVGLL